MHRLPDVGHGGGVLPVAGAPDLVLIPDLPVLDPGGLVPGLIPDPQALRGRD